MDDWITVPLLMTLLVHVNVDVVNSVTVSNTVALTVAISVDVLQTVEVTVVSTVATRGCRVTVVTGRGVGQAPWLATVLVVVVKTV